MSRYSGQADHAHGTVPCMGVLLTNLGTPDAPTPRPCGAISPSSCPTRA